MRADIITADWSATPEAVPYARLSDPQTLNQYAYVRNNPISLTDPDGHGIIAALRSVLCSIGNGGSCLQASAQQSLEQNQREEASQKKGIKNKLRARELMLARSSGNQGPAIKWELEHKSKEGGQIIQHIEVRDKSGELAPGINGKPLNYWEAWNVPKNSNHTDSKVNYDDSFSDQGGYAVRGEARFYEGLTLPKSFQVGNVPEAGNLPSTNDNPNLATDHATAPVVRSWTSNAAQ